LMFDQIVIEESRGAPDPEAAAALLAEKCIEAGMAAGEEVETWIERLRFAAQHAAIATVDPRDALRSLAQGLRSLSELEAAARDGGLLRALARQLATESRRLLEEIAPARIRLAGGREVKVHYEPNQAPWIESRLQDFFGMRATPAVARGAVPVVVRLLAPNHR